MGIHFENGVVWTGDAKQPRATSFRVANGVVTHIGGVAEAEDEIVDLGGAFVTPILADMHTHPLWVADTFGRFAALPPAVATVEDIVAGLKAVGETTPEGAWIEGWGYDESLLEDGVGPTRDDLDRVSKDRPVFLRRSDCHSAVVNSKLLEMAGLTDETPDPAGGAFGRDASGRLDGRLIEVAACAAVDKLRPKRDREERIALMMKLGPHYHARGIGCVTEMMADAEAFSLWREAYERGLKLGCALYIVWKGGEDPFGMPDLTEDEKTGPVRAAGVKLFADGSVSGATAAVTKPYLTGGTGSMTLTQPVFEAALAWARRNGVQVSVHAMGDATLATIADWLEGVDDWLWESGAPSVRIEHASLLTPELGKRFAALPVRFGVTLQPVFSFAEWPAYEKVLDEERLCGAQPARTACEFFDAVALTSDAPATTWADPDQPFVIAAAAVSRTTAAGKSFGAQESVAPETALRLLSSRAAKLVTGPYVGVLRRGAPADFVCWSENPLTATTGGEIAAVRARITWIAGEPVWADPKVLG